LVESWEDRTGISTPFSATLPGAGRSLLLYAFGIGKWIMRPVCDDRYFNDFLWNWLPVLWKMHGWCDF
jgi:hypothetical protein